MQNVRIVTHSGCDLTFAEARDNGIVMLPDLVVFGGEQYRNNIDIGPETIYRRLEKAKIYKQSRKIPQALHHSGRWTMRYSEDFPRRGTAVFEITRSFSGSVFCPSADGDY